MGATEIQAIGDTLMRVVTPDMTPKHWPKLCAKSILALSKRAITRAAFFSIISNADQDLGKAKNLRAFALAERSTRLTE